MKPIVRPFIITGIIGAICSLTGLFFLGMAIGYNKTHAENQSAFTPIGIVFFILGILIIVFSSTLYKKKVKSLGENKTNP